VLKPVSQQGFLPSAAASSPDDLVHAAELDRSMSGCSPDNVQAASVDLEP
jgi:hypothetical protein